MHILGPHQYVRLPRRMEGGLRLYTTPDGADLPSVTTILNNTMSLEKKEGLEGWAESIGVENAVRIKNEAAHVGEHMHDTLEAMMAGERPKPGRGPLAQHGVRMGAEVFQTILPMVDEVWGLEVPLHYPGAYAGTTDLVGVVNGRPSIVDYKQANRRKEREWLGSYVAQSAMYAIAHNHLFGTCITDFHIVVCTRQLEVDVHHFGGHDFAAAVDEAAEHVKLWRSGHRCTTSF